MIAAEPHADDERWSLAVVIVSAAALLRLVFAAAIPAFPDETYYWDWSRHLAAGYFDHPPGLALLIRFGTTVLAPLGMSAAPLAVRVGPIVAGGLAALATIATARRVAGNEAACRAAIIISVLPLAAAGLILATPDALVLATTAIGLYGVVRALDSPAGSTASLRWWATTGVVLGLAFASKYTSIFLPVGVLCATVARADLRARLREPGPYVACVLATLVFSPVLSWNAHHGWISLVFQLRHGLSAPEGSALRAAWKHEGDFLGGQAGLASPILFVMLAIATARSLTRRAPAAQFVLAMVATVSFTFFLYSAIRQRVEPNWPAPAYVPAIVLLATAQWSGRSKRWLNAGVGLAAVLSVLIYVQAVVPILPVAPRKDPIARAFGWAELTVSADSAANLVSASTARATWLGADRYQEASELAFHDPLHPPTFSLNMSGRRNQYDLWPAFSDLAKIGDNLVLVLDESDEQPGPIARLSPYFSEVRRSKLITLSRRGSEIGRRRLWTLVGWRGGWPITPPPGHTPVF